MMTFICAKESLVVLNYFLLTELTQSDHSQMHLGSAKHNKHESARNHSNERYEMSDTDIVLVGSDGGLF